MCSCFTHSNVWRVCFHLYYKCIMLHVHARLFEFSIGFRISWTNKTSTISESLSAPQRRSHPQRRCVFAVQRSTHSFLYAAMLLTKIRSFAWVNGVRGIFTSQDASSAANWNLHTQNQYFLCQYMNTKKTTHTHTSTSF